MQGEIILRDVAHNQWLRFEAPREIIVANELAEVLPALTRVEAWVNEHDAYAAGFIAYEAAPAFDNALAAHPLRDFPPVWFGLYNAPTLVQSPVSSLQSPNAHKALNYNWTPNVARETYNVAIARIREHIARGDTYQVNYTMRLRADFDGDAWALFTRLVCAQPNSYAAFMDTGRYVICSASPELFLPRGAADDVLLWNERGEITETCAANIVVQFGDDFFTPPVECGLHCALFIVL